ncbi:hypothetical protein BR93DRAFT_202427 [Coniochaeta sp. PMI_546]|nr:hypothetical protein BR93DRAFT_202427 [Coniochaeta sp. PMI_546]
MHVRRSRPRHPKVASKLSHHAAPVGPGDADSVTRPSATSIALRPVPFLDSRMLGCTISCAELLTCESACRPCLLRFMILGTLSQVLHSFILSQWDHLGHSASREHLP